MDVRYVCPHCGTEVGRLNGSHLTEAQLGFHSLTLEERSDIIAYSVNGDVTVKVTCDYCKQALETNPELMLVANPLQ
ncbi:anti-sigma-F factor Fin [Paenibacillus mesotrionivorans]|jgi:transposase-like protein|uniref:Anti-sigma-F factor Fin n=1 Tax=Paenibacillus mesotrionivorans TaxID=3160968 RepID=A0ACC7P4Z6_9BACL